MTAALIAVGVLYPRASEVADNVVTTAPDPLAARRQRTPPAAPDHATPEGAVIARPAISDSAALDAYKAAADRRPDDGPAQNSLGQMLVKLNRVDEAIPYFEKAIALDPNLVAARMNLGGALERTRRTSDAIAVYREVQRRSPNDAAAAFRLGRALQHDGNEAGALAEFQKASALEPGDESFRRAVAESLERTKR